jgi:pyruvate/2-oxoglutarate dehydrogenase complex dihydrolipoamide acyltransferase (E2) component
MGKVNLPLISDREQYATIARWFFDEGEYIHNGDAIVEVMIDDVPYTIIAECSGTLMDLRYREGDVVNVPGHIANITE